MVVDKIVAFLRLCRFFLCWLFMVRGWGISLLVPVSLPDPQSQRAINWYWLKRYWKKTLPGAEIIIGEDPRPLGIPFSKSTAVNDAARKARGDVFVIVDADACISGDGVLRCAEEIRAAEKKHRTLWFVPYRKLVRLTKDTSEAIVRLKPQPNMAWPLEGQTVNGTGHWYGAMMQIMSHRAFEAVGGWDSRFRGWGGEDYAAMAAMDTLYGPHKTLPSELFHIWHPAIFTSVLTKKGVKRRLWDGQDTMDSNSDLSQRYYRCEGNREKMRRLVNESLTPGFQNLERADRVIRRSRVPAAIST
jgi:hypothetical protein